VTIWHAEEVVDALDAGALVSLDEVADDPLQATLDRVDSFRISDIAGSDVSATDDGSEGTE
jgi:hypothetical protein